MSDEEKIICEDCQEGNHCNDEGDDDCDCDCTYEDENDKDVKTVDEVDEGYTPESSEDIADDHMTHDRTGLGRMITTMLIISGIIIGVAYVYDNGMIDFVFPLNSILQPDNPIVKETINNNPDIVRDFVEGCDLRLIKTGNVVTGGNLQCWMGEPTVEKVNQAKQKFTELYG